MLTLIVAVLCAYAVPFVLLLLASITIDGSRFPKVGHAAALGGFAQPDWVAASMATVGRVLGPGLEDMTEVGRRGIAS